MSDAVGFAEVSANNLHQLALLMPGSVVSYEVLRIEEHWPSPAIADAELFEQLACITIDIAAK